MLGDFDCDEESATGYSRENVLHIIIGDNATTKNIRSTRWNNYSAYNWVSELPGDFHCSGYIEECFAKALGPGRLYHAVNKILGKFKYMHFTVTLTGLQGLPQVFS